MEETKKETSSVSERLYNGLIRENPTFVLTLGMCPTLAVTTSAINGLGMGLTTMVVLALSNAFISLLRKVIPDKVRIPAFIVIIASFVTVMELLLEAYLPSLYDALGIYIPLIVVNCIILGRAESFASKNPVILSLFDGIGMGLGFTFALTCIGMVRELLGSGKLFGVTVMLQSFTPVSIFVMAPGAFFVLALLTAVQNQIKLKGEAKGRDMSRIGSGCPGGCDSCGIEGCESRRFYDPDTAGSVEEAAKRREEQKERTAAETKPKETKTVNPKGEVKEPAKAEDEEEKPEETKLANSKGEAKEPAKAEAEEGKPEETKPANSKDEVNEPAKAEAEEEKEEEKPEETKPEETKPANSKGEVKEPAKAEAEEEKEEEKPEETKPEETKPEETKPVNAKGEVKKPAKEKAGKRRSQKRKGKAKNTVAKSEEHKPEEKKTEGGGET